MTPRIERRSDLDRLIADGVIDPDDPEGQVEVQIVLSVECDICGPITPKSRATFQKKETFAAPWADNGVAHSGTLVIPADEGILLNGDAQDMLEEHWEAEHPNVPRVFISDGQHGVRMARKGLVLP